MPPKTYCVKCKKKTENINPFIEMTKTGRKMLRSECPLCGIIKAQFTK